ncbi:hypothetical protein [Vibrio atlanticus]|uniref:Uncharacterized protein n=1 Tax=Vibrio atlanticus TaxID=693153 RepID=A0A1C3IMZ8_9VIBR|nr:hypothetical protein [Vibrio atlanticus]SBS62718.1 hypothetical protein VAT7223_01314 [Vibrio atlanticus]
MHDSPEELALRHAKKFVEYCELYIKYQNVLHLEADQDLPLIIESEVRKYLIGASIYSDVRYLYGTERILIPSPEDLVRKWGKNDNRFDSSPYYTFYKEELYPLYIKHQDHSGAALLPTNKPPELVNDDK